MTRHGWLLYGANGFTGRLIAEEAVRRGLRPILAGRDAAAIGALAARLGLPHRVFSLADDFDRELADVAAIVLAAGPFSSTATRVVDACLRTGTHYLDINGDIAVFEAIFARATDAERADTVLVSGVGFDVVPTDCVAAALHAALPDADRLELAFGGDMAPSRGTSKATVEILPRGGAIREHGAIRVVPTAWRTQPIAFATGTKRAVTVPWGDVSTAYRSTGIPNIAVYMQMPRLAIWSMKMMRPFLPLVRLGFVRRALNKLIEWTVRGPNARALATGRTQVWGRATNVAGETRTATTSCPDGYQLTAIAALEAVSRVLAGHVAPGAHTPSTAFGASFVEQLAGCAPIAIAGAKCNQSWSGVSPTPARLEPASPREHIEITR
jgi:saccharopine dehydrogenase (NAD+, L-lysine-forming)